MATARNKAVTALKIVTSVALLYFIFTKIDLGDVLVLLRRSRPLYLLLALLFFVVSKVLAAVRLNLYFYRLKVFLTQKSNLKLYVLGMFYNLFLPGGIGGDAYKGYRIKQGFGVETKKVVSVLVLDRLSGMLSLGIYGCLLGLLLENPFFERLDWLFVLAIGLGILAFWLLTKRFFNYTLPVFWPSLGYSFLVQLAQLFSVWCILKALAIQVQTAAYLFVFLISSIVSILPITIGGIGSRELTFLYGAKFLGLDESNSVGISMVFFVITALVSLTGMYYHFKKPNLAVKASQ